MSKDSGSQKPIWAYLLTSNPGHYAVPSDSRKRKLGLELSSPVSVTDMIYKLAFSSDGKVIASAYSNGRVKLQDFPGHRHRATIRTHTKSVRQVAFSPDGQKLVTAGEDKMIRIWDTCTYQRINTVRWDESDISDLMFSPDSKAILWLDDNRDILIWDIATAKFIHKDLSCYNAVVISPDTKYIVNQSIATVDIHDVSAKTHVAEMDDPFRSVVRVVFSLDSRLLLIRYDNNLIKLFCTKTWKRVQKWEVPRSNPYLNIAISHTIVAVEIRQLNEIAIYSIFSDRCLGVIPINRDAYLYDMQVSPDDRFLVCGGSNLSCFRSYDLYHHIPLLCLDHLIACGLSSGSSTLWTRFLATGLYDPRLFAFFIRPFLGE